MVDLEIQEQRNCCGIDLGTAYSAIGVWKENRVVILTNDEGNRTTPSTVSFGDKRVVGAETRSNLEGETFVYDVKRLIGRRFSDLGVKEDISLLPYNIVEGKDDSIVIEVEYLGETKRFTPEEISAMVLRHLKEMAERFLGAEVSEAVVTVPAYFTDSQRQATKDACLVAGLVPLRLINEPTAAALAYGLDTVSTVNLQVIMCFDWGAGTLDVSLIKIEDGTFEVKAVSGNNRLGGRDITNRMVDHLVSDILENFKVDVSEDWKVKRRLYAACEDAKKYLTFKLSRMIQLESLFTRNLLPEEITENGVQATMQDYSYLFTRAKYEDVCTELFQKALFPVQQVLEDSKLPKSKVDEVVLIGGSSRIPKIQKMLEEFFDGKELNKSIDPDECVAFGATVQAAILTNQKDTNLEGLLMLDVCPISLGVETNGGIMTKIITRNNSIPTERTMSFSTSTDNQQRVLVQVYEGERILTRDCNLLGKFYLENIPELPRGKPEIDVTFKIDINGILKVSAIEKSTGNKREISVTKTAQKSPEDYERMIKEAEEFSRQDKQTEELNKAKIRYENGVLGIRNFYDGNDKISEDLRNKYESVVKKHIEKFNDTTDFTVEQYEEAFEILKAEIGIFDKYEEKPELKA